jgi:DNA invertase Pin-like site-specific DNA recombinase
LTFLRDGDALVVTRPDRLTRNTAELLTIETDLSKRSVGFIIRSIGKGERLDTRNPTSKLILTTLAGVATWGREVPFRSYSFELACADLDIQHRPTKPRHPWTNGQVERITRTIKEATVKRFY